MGTDDWVDAMMVWCLVSRLSVKSGHGVCGYVGKTRPNVCHSHCSCLQYKFSDYNEMSHTALLC